MFVPDFMATHLVVAATLTQKDRCEPDDGAMQGATGSPVIKVYGSGTMNVQVYQIMS